MRLPQNLQSILRKACDRCGLVGLFILLLSTAAQPADACTTPVFRYALERWPADAFQLTVFHRQPLDEQQTAWVEQLRAQSTAGGGQLNLEIQLADVDQLSEPEQEQLWQRVKGQTLPALAMTYPPAGARQGLAWTGPLDQSSVAALTDSPARREIARRILAGDSVVWVLLESGDQAKDNATFTNLEALLSQAREAATVILADADTAASDDPNAAPMPPVRFSILRLSRRDPAEQVLIQVLLHSEDELNQFTEPMVLPIFGRGRVLYALVGRGINAANVGEACAFLTGPCSCIIKEENPGTDLLISAAWDEGITESFVQDVELPPLTGLSAAELPDEPLSVTGDPNRVTGRLGASAVPTGDTPAVPVSGAGPVAVVEPPSSHLQRNVLMVIAAAVVVVLAISVPLYRRARRGGDF